MTVHRNRRKDAACRDADPDLFIPVSTTGADLAAAFAGTLVPWARTLTSPADQGPSAEPGVNRMARMLCRSSSVVFSPDPRGDRVL
jgi:hypothetical protein